MYYIKADVEIILHHDIAEMDPHSMSALETST